MTATTASGTTVNLSGTIETTSGALAVTSGSSMTLGAAVIGETWRRAWPNSHALLAVSLTSNSGAMDLDGTVDHVMEHAGAHHLDQANLDTRFIALIDFLCSVKREHTC